MHSPASFKPHHQYPHCSTAFRWQCRWFTYFKFNYCVHDRLLLPGLQWVLGVFMIMLIFHCTTVAFVQRPSLIIKPLKFCAYFGVRREFPFYVWTDISFAQWRFVSHAAFHRNSSQCIAQESKGIFSSEPKNDFEPGMCHLRMWLMWSIHIMGVVNVTSGKERAISKRESPCSSA